jgi:hypothetical protein
MVGCINRRRQGGMNGRRQRGMADCMKRRRQRGMVSIKLKSRHQRA